MSRDIETRTIKVTHSPVDQEILVVVGNSVFKKELILNEQEARDLAFKLSATVGLIQRK